MARSRTSRLVAAVVLLACATPASADESLWEELARPQRPRRAELMARATELLLTGNPAAAATLLEQAVALDPTEPVGHLLLGKARYRLRAWPACAESLLSVTRLDPQGTASDPELLGDPDERVPDMLGLCLALGGRLDDAVAHYRRLLDAPPPGARLDTLHGNLGDVYHALGRLDEAAEAYQAALAIAPRRAAVHAALAVALDRDERAERSHAEMARALEIDPQLAELTSAGTFFIPPADLHYYLGLGHQAGGRRAQAIASFRRYLEVAGDAPWTARARLHLTELGSPALRAEDIIVLPAGAPEGPLIARGLLATAPELQACLGTGARTVVVRASVAYHGHGKEPRPASPSVSLSSAGPEAASPEVIDCLEKKLSTRKHVVRQTTRIQVAIGAP